MQKLTGREIIPFVRDKLPKEYYDKAIKEVQQEKFDAVKFVLGAWDFLTKEKDKVEFIKLIAGDMFFGPKLFDQKIKGTKYEGQYLAILLGDSNK